MIILMAFVSFFVNFSSAQSVNSPELYAQFEIELKSPTGVEVEVHGADHQNGLYVISYRPKNFFDYVIVALQADYNSPNYAAVNAQLLTLRRHDILQIKGDTNSTTMSYQSHVLINEFNILKKYTSSYDSGEEYKHYTETMTALQGKSSLVVKVHASLVDGNVFVVEYGDVNIPVVVGNNQLTKDLYRGDKVEIKFAVKKSPSAPSHIKLGLTPDSLVVLDRIVEQHGKDLDICGELVMFPQSPQVIFNVFALKFDIGDNLFRTYTLVNFEDVDLFKALREKLQVAWDANTLTMVQGRNYFLNPKLKVCAKGKGNMIVPTQANPQVLIDRVEDLSVEVLP